MKRLIFVSVIGMLVVILAGCSVNTKLIERERVDQEIVTAGNRGYLFGTPPPAPERKTTREYYEIQVEVPPVIEKESRVPKAKKEEEVSRGTPIYVAPEIPERKIEVIREVPAAPKEEYANYTVQKDDTLQKISQKFYGTTKKWRKIFLANQDKLSAPDKVYPGQVLRIPQGATRESEYIK